MKRNVFAILAVSALLAFSTAAFAVGPDPLEGSADCYGWQFGGTMYFGTWDCVDYDFTMELYQGMTLLYSFADQGTLCAADGQEFMFEGDWDMMYEGELTMVVTFWWYGEYGPGVKKVEYTFECEDEKPPTCTFTPGYWKNHPDAWPVDGLTVGCVDYTKTELLILLDLPAKSGITVKLFHHLVAAKLNVLWGSDDYIQSAIDAGDLFLCDHPLHSVLSDELKTEAEMIKDELCEYNEIECEEEEDRDDLMSISGPAKVENAAAREESSWGAIKKKHQ